MQIPDHIMQVTIDRLGAFQPDPRPEPRVPLMTGIIVDTETTGLALAADRVIDLALIHFRFCPVTGIVVEARTAYEGLQDPQMPIDPGATAVHGLTNAMVAGQRIEWETVAGLLRNADLVIAHNAGFDRPFVRKELTIAGLPKADNDNQWGCSLTQIDWKSLCHPPANKLEVLALWYGFFYAAHRAQADCWALLALLQRSRALPALYKASLCDGYRVWALDANYDSREVIKQRRAEGRKYEWQPKPGKNAWFIELASTQAADAEIAWLGSTVYLRGPNKACIERLPAKSRFLG